MTTIAHLASRLALCLSLCGGAAVAAAEPVAEHPAGHTCEADLFYPQKLRGANGVLNDRVVIGNDHADGSGIGCVRHTLPGPRSGMAFSSCDAPEYRRFQGQIGL